MEEEAKQPPVTEQVQVTWIQYGITPPAQCTGNCNMFDGCVMRECLTCGWDDY